MQLVEIAQRLVASLDASTALLTQMVEGLRSRRTNWISARASVLAEPAVAMGDLAARLEQEERKQRELLDQAASSFAPLTGAPGKRRIHASDLCEQLPTFAAQRLRKSADKAALASKAVRRELALGERLLRFSQAAHESLVAGVTVAAQTRDDIGSYDRNARRVGAALPSTGTRPGSLVDGRI
jgi:hypothetical protein